MRPCLFLSPLLLTLYPATLWAEANETVPPAAVMPAGPSAGLKDEALTAHCRAWAAVTAVRQEERSWPGAAAPSAEANLLAEAKPLMRNSLGRQGMDAPPQ